MLELDLSLGARRRRGAAAVSVPTAIVLSSDEVVKTAAIGTVVGTLITVGGVAPYTYTELTDAGGLFSIDGDEVKVAADLSEVESQAYEVRVTDANGATHDETFTITAVVSEDNDSGIGSGDGEIVDDGGFEKIIVDDTSGGLKITGKTGGNAKFVYDVGAFPAGSSKIVEYSIDYSLMNKLGVGVFAGLGFKSGNNWWFVGIRGDGATPTLMRDWQITGTDFGNRATGEHLDAGLSEHGTKNGPVRLRIAISEDGEKATLEYSGDLGETWDASFVDADPTSLASLSDAPTSGFSMYFPNNEKGVFALTIAVWTPVDAPVDFFATDGSSQPFNSSYDPVAVYHAGSDISHFAYNAINAGQRMLHATSYNHTAGAYGEIEAAGFDQMVGDEHGIPTILIDHEGHKHVFGGVYEAGMRHYSTRSDGTWAFRGEIPGVFTYPQPVLVGSTIYIFMRETSTGTRGKLVLVKTESLSNGVARWGDPIEIVDYGASSHVYDSYYIVRGTDIHQVGVRSNGDKSVREDVYYRIYETTTGNVKNHDGGVTVLAANLPLDLTTSNASFRLVETTNQSYVPSLCFDTNDDPHVLFSDGIRGGAFDIRHIKRTSGGWSSPETVETTNSATYPFFALVALPSAEVAMYFEENDADTYTRGGNTTRRVRTSGGTWGSRVQLLAAPPANGRPTAVRDGHANARIVLSEIGQTADGTGSEDDLKIYAHGDGGFLQRGTPGTAPTVASLILDASDRGEGTDPDFADVVLLVDFSVGD